MNCSPNIFQLRETPPFESGPNSNHAALMAYILLLIHFSVNAKKYMLVSMVLFPQIIKSLPSHRRVSSSKYFSMAKNGER